MILKLINQSIETTKITRINTTGSGFIYNGPLSSNGNFQYKDYEKYARKETLSFIFLEEFYRPAFSKSILIWFTDVSNKEKRMQINIKGYFEKSEQN